MTRKEGLELEIPEEEIGLEDGDSGASKTSASTHHWTDVVGHSVTGSFTVERTVDEEGHVFASTVASYMKKGARRRVRTAINEITKPLQVHRETDIERFWTWPQRPICVSWEMQVSKNQLD